MQWNAEILAGYKAAGFEVIWYPLGGGSEQLLAVAGARNLVRRLTLSRPSTVGGFEPLNNSEHQQHEESLLIARQPNF